MDVSSRIIDQASEHPGQESRLNNLDGLHFLTDLEVKV